MLPNSIEAPAQVPRPQPTTPDRMIMASRPSARATAPASPTSSTASTKALKPIHTADRQLSAAISTTEDSAQNHHWHRWPIEREKRFHSFCKALCGFFVFCFGSFSGFGCGASSGCSGGTASASDFSALPRSHSKKRFSRSLKVSFAASHGFFFSPLRGGIQCSAPCSVLSSISCCATNSGSPSLAAISTSCLLWRRPSSKYSA